MSEWRIKYYSLNIFLRLRTTANDFSGICEIPFNSTIFFNVTENENIVYLLNEWEEIKNENKTLCWLTSIL